MKSNAKSGECVGGEGGGIEWREEKQESREEGGLHKGEPENFVFGNNCFVTFRK